MAEVDNQSFWKEGSLGKKTPEGARLLFAQVREDEAIERALWRSLTEDGQSARALNIASGGCTALSLLACNQGKVDAIDINPAQIAITELKLAALKQLELEDFRTVCVRDARDAYSHLRPHLTDQTRTFFDGRRHILGYGLNLCGWIDRKLEKLVSLFHAVVQNRKRTEAFLVLNDPAAQRAAFEEHWNNWRWRLALNVAFSRSLLSLGYGANALKSLPPDFPRIMKIRIEQALTEHPAATNPYLWQTFLSRYPESEEGFPYYLQTAGWHEARSNADNLRMTCTDIVTWLKNQPDKTISFFAISNILEIVEPTYKIELLKQIARTSRDRALICVRSIFPQDSPIFEDPSRRLEYDPVLSRDMQEKDRGLFCTFIQIFRATR